MFYEYIRILKEVKPEYFVLENVVSMSPGNKKLINENIGFDPIVIDAQLVSAQRRKRLFWVGKLVGDKYERVTISQPLDKGILLKDILQKTVDEKYILLDSTVRRLTNNGEGFHSKIVSDGKSSTLMAGMAKNCRGMSLIEYWDRHRKLTPIECLRLQSLPDDYLNDSIPDTQKYKMVGNSFNCGVIEHLLQEVLK